MIPGRLPGLLLLFLSGCAGSAEPPLTVANRFDPGFDFSATRTFAWGEAQPTADPRLDDLQLDARLHGAVAAALEARGLHEQALDADLSVWLYPQLVDGADVTMAGDGVGFAAPHVSHEVGSAESGVDIFRQGGLVLDLVDTTTNRVVWRGRVAGQVELDASLAARDARLRQALEDLLAGFPPEKPGLN